MVTQELWISSAILQSTVCHQQIKHYKEPAVLIHEAHKDLYPANRIQESQRWHLYHRELGNQ